MKAEHRHELKTNELAEWLINFPNWAKENLKTIIYISVVAVLVIASAVFHWYGKNVEAVQQDLNFTSGLAIITQSQMQILQGQAKGLDLSYMLIQAADKLDAIARDTSNDRSASLALIKGADALRMELHYRTDTPSGAEIAAQINKAKDSYNQALQKTANTAALAVAATFGLALCEEELGNFQAAEDIYAEIITNPDFEPTVSAAQAKLRLVIMADYRNKPVFKPSEKKQAPAAAPKPQIELLTPGASQ